MESAPDVPRASHRLVSVTWLVRLRWLAALGQAAALALLVWGLDQGAPLGAIGGALVLGALSNLWLQLAARRPVRERVLVAILALDTALLTVILAVTGGAASPLTLLYLVPVVFAGLTTSSRATWALLVVTGVEYAGLFAFAPEAEHAGHHGDAFGAHVVGMLLAYVLTGPLIAFAVTRIRLALAQADARTAEALELEARTRRVGALATLAAGASHELASPLSTIYLVSGELLRAPCDDRTRADLELVRAEVERCREVLAQLAADAGAGHGEHVDWVEVGGCLVKAVRGRATVEVSDSLRSRLPARLVAQVVRRLVGNARDATPDGQAVYVRARAHGGGLMVEVEDGGEGMSAEVRARAIEPFFTTKPQGRGSGLGLFYVSSVVHQLGGELTLDSQPGRGTTVRVWLPAETTS